MTRLLQRREQVPNEEHVEREIDRLEERNLEIAARLSALDPEFEVIARELPALSQGEARR